MIERVARAMFDCRFDADDADIGLGRKETVWQETAPLWRDCARAAIAAMRELTETEMIAGGECLISVTQLQDFGPSASFSAPVGEWWRAVIDAALKRTP